jgi:hypothetical protein
MDATETPTTGWLRNLVHNIPHLLATHTVLIAPVVLLGVGLLLAAAPRRTVCVGLLLVLAVHYQVLRVPGQLRHAVAVEDGVATSEAVACRLGSVGRPFAQCPPIVLSDPFAGPLRLVP